MAKHRIKTSRERPQSKWQPKYGNLLVPFQNYSPFYFTIHHIIIMYSLNCSDILTGFVCSPQNQRAILVERDSFAKSSSQESWWYCTSKGRLNPLKTWVKEPVPAGKSTLRCTSGRWFCLNRLLASALFCCYPVQRFYNLAKIDGLMSCQGHHKNFC